MGSSGSSVHRMVAGLRSALAALGSPATSIQAERLGLRIHEALGSRARLFHSHRHALDLADGVEPLESIAALYHDLVYVQVDQGVPACFRELLSRYVEERPQLSYAVTDAAWDDEACRDVLHVFGVGAGHEADSSTGINELLSAIVAGKQLEPVLDRGQRVAIAAAIEATIPFRDHVATPLVARLHAMALPGLDVDAAVRRAVRLANRDVGSFAAPDAAGFLAETWNLLPEINPALYTPSIYTVADYRYALQKMETFLARLRPERVFHTFGDEPGPEVHAARVENCRRNLNVAGRYLRCKLYSVSLIEALAVASGGDAALGYFMGGMPDEDPSPARRLDELLPRGPAGVPGDPELVQLLVGGRGARASFDLAPSPVAAFLLTRLGEERTSEGVVDARRWWAGSSDTHEFLDGQPPGVVADIARAMAGVADTRAEPLLSLAAELEARAHARAV